jgi:cell division septation protein DedD
VALTPDSSDPSESATERLYRATLGEASAGRYLPVFERFDDQGMAGPTWNTAAALFHLGWLVHHRLWLSFVGCAAFGAAVALAVMGLWHWAPGWPTGIKLGASLAMALSAMLVPGLWGTAWLHTRSRRRMISAVELAATVDGACVTLSAQARDRQRRNTWGLAGLLSAGVLAALLWQTVPWATFAGGAQSSTPEKKADPVADVVPAPAVVAEAKTWPPQASAFPKVDEAKAASDAVSEEELAPAGPQAPTAQAIQTPASTPTQVAAQILNSIPVVTPEVLSKPVDPVVSAKRRVSSAATTAAAPTESATPAKALPKPAARSPAASAVEPASAPVPMTKTPGKAPTTTASSPPTPTAQATAPSTALLTEIRTRVKGFGVAVGMFAVADNAEKVAAQLSKAGLPVLSDPVDSARGRLMRVRVGPFERREQAEAAAVKVEALGLEARVYTP